MFIGAKNFYLTQAIKTQDHIDFYLVMPERIVLSIQIPINTDIVYEVVAVNLIRLVQIMNCPKNLSTIQNQRLPYFLRNYSNQLKWKFYPYIKCKDDLKVGMGELLLKKYSLDKLHF